MSSGKLERQAVGNDMKVVMIHGWSGHPHEGWFPWLKSELEKGVLMSRRLSCQKPKSPEYNVGYRQ